MILLNLLNNTNTDNATLDKGLWRFIDNLIDDPLNLEKKGYKHELAISQLFAHFNSNKILCY